MQRSMSFDNWVAYIEEAEEFFIYPAIGTELYDELSLLVGEENEEDVSVGGTAEQKRLIKLLKMSLMAYADFSGMMRQIVSTGDAGKTQITPQNQQAVSKWATAASMKAAILRGDNALENALKFLEKNADEFETWKTSEVFLEKAGLLVNNATKLTEWFPQARGSRRMFLALEAGLRQAQAEIGVALGEAFLVEVLAKNKLWMEGSLTDANWLKLLKMCGQVVARKAVADFVPFMNIDADWHLWSTTDGLENKDVLPPSRRNEIAAELGDQWRDGLATIVDFLQKTASDSVFATYYSSDMYTALVETPPTRLFENDKKRSYGVL
ncbi:DUF6712 family protein [Lacihabitans soyangensis]|uniref:DUF6712 family protein n=1 Tax=Lacihabitans soyangensis TaxID=869394 RepID=UPI0020CE9D81|nr:DUF6712 family protein [Lacihabitans soyangensis]